MNNGIKIAIAGVVAAAAYYLRGVHKVAVTLKSFRLSKLTINSVVFEPVFSISNPSAISVSPTRLTGTLYVDNVTVGQVNQNFTGKVAAKAITDASVSVVCNYTDLTESIKYFVNNASASSKLEVSFDGTLYFGSIKIPVKTTKSFAEFLQNAE